MAPLGACQQADGLGKTPLLRRPLLLIYKMESAESTPGNPTLCQSMLPGVRGQGRDNKEGQKGGMASPWDPGVRGSQAAREHLACPVEGQNAIRSDRSHRHLAATLPTEAPRGSWQTPPTPSLSPQSKSAALLSPAVCGPAIATPISVPPTPAPTAVLPSQTSHSLSPP